MNNTPVLYRVEPHDPSGHRFRITLTVANPDPAGQTVSLPAWIPGSYLIRDFSRQIETLTARSNGRSIQTRKLDNHTWQAAACAAPLVLQYVVYAWDLSVRGAHFDHTHAFFNGTSVFLRVHGQEDLPCEVDIAPPVGHADWKVYTSLPMASGKGAARRGGFGRYAAPDYDALIDHPVEMGMGQSISFTAHGAEHEMVFINAHADIDLTRIAADVQRICETQIAFFEPRTRRAPFLDSAPRYVFMTHVTPNGYGGLEHRASTALIASRKDIPVRGKTETDDGYRTFLGLVSHEYFHTWHVKRIKPAVFAPYDLTRPQLTRLLWVFEGFTSYYDDLFLLRSGVVDEATYFRLLAKTVTQVANAPGRHKQSIAESSFDAWTRYYKQDENSPNALVSYYTKGALVALGLDLTIRQNSAGKRSLDDVMQLLWTRFGRDFYRGKGRGVDEDAMAGLILEATGVDVRRMLSQCVEGRADVPLERLLASQGITLGWQASATAPTFNARFRTAADGLVVAFVQENGAAHKGGLSAGDVIVAADEQRIDTQAALDDFVARRAPGTWVRLQVFRNDILHDLRVKLASPPMTTCTIKRSLA